MQRSTLIFLFCYICNCCIELPIYVNMKERIGVEAPQGFIQQPLLLYTIHKSNVLNH